MSTAKTKAEHYRFLVMCGGYRGYYGSGDTLKEAEENCRKAAGGTRNFSAESKSGLKRLLARSELPFAPTNRQKQPGESDFYVSQDGTICWSGSTVTITNLDTGETTYPVG